jgi:GNAT superfamily N-acetyltransferase
MIVEIRRMRLEDASGIHEVHTAAVRETCARLLTPAVIEAWLYGRMPEGYLSAAESGESFWVAVDEAGCVVGFASWQEDELLALFIDPSVHGQGIGGRLFAACERDAAEAGRSITCVNASLNAVSYYQALGFRAVGEGHQQKRGERIPHIEMVREVGPGEVPGDFPAGAR